MDAKKNYEKPAVEIIHYSEDVILSSGDSSTGNSRSYSSGYYPTTTYQP